jgi:hypothetical protein
MYRVDSLRWNGRLFAAIVLGALWLASLDAIIAHRHDNQWDFEVYYFAAKAWTRGLNPYELNSLKYVGGRDDSDLSFVYPPITLPFFRLFTLVPYGVSRNIWLALKILGLMALLGLWRRTFLKNVDGLVFLVTALMAFNGATLWDLETGNVTIFEQLFLWAGFWYYLRGQRAYFTFYVVLGSIFKITPIVLLGLLIFPRERRKTGLLLLVAGLATFVLLASSPLLFRPALLSTFLASLKDLPLGAGPCAFGLISLVGRHFLAPEFPVLMPILVYVVWSVYVISVAALSYRPLLSALRGDDRLTALVYSIFVYALIQPRLVTYSYMILIVPALFLLYGLPASIPTVTALLLPLCIPTQGLNVGTAAIISAYYPFFLALGLWYMLIRGHVDLGKAAQILVTQNPETDQGEVK